MWIIISPYIWNYGKVNHKLLMLKKIKLWFWKRLCEETFFLSLYSRFYDVIILKGTYAIVKEKMQNV
jgi:hypothetical protein